MSRVPHTGHSHMCGKIEFPSTSEMSVQPKFAFSGELFRCGNSFRSVDSEDHGERRSSEDKFSPQGGLFHEAASEWHQKCDRAWKSLLGEGCIHGAAIACNDTQVQSTTSTPHQDTTVPSRGTQSTSTSTATAGGVGGGEPPEDGRGRPLDRSNCRDKDDSEDEFEIHTTCKHRPQTIKVFFAAEAKNKHNLEIMMAKCMYCSQKCAESGSKGDQKIIPVILLDEDLSSYRNCLVCYLFEMMPLAVCNTCHTFMCGECNYSSIKSQYNRCPISCGGTVIHLMLPDSIAVPERLQEINLPPDQSRNITDQERQHLRRQWEDENRRLEEANELQDLSAAAEVQGSRLMESSSESLHVVHRHLSDDSDREATAAEPPAEEFQPPNAGGEVEQGTDIEEDSLEQRSNQQQQYTVG